MKKICSRCGRKYTRLENYCSKCGIELIKVPNKCSEEKTSLCKGLKLEDDDLFCPYCGSPTTYALGMKDGEW